MTEEQYPKASVAEVISFMRQRHGQSSMEAAGILWDTLKIREQEQRTATISVKCAVLGNISQDPQALLSEAACYVLARSRRTPDECSMCSIALSGHARTEWGSGLHWAEAVLLQDVAGAIECAVDITDIQDRRVGATLCRLQPPNDR